MGNPQVFALHLVWNPVYCVLCYSTSHTTKPPLPHENATNRKPSSKAFKKSICGRNIKYRMVKGVIQVWCCLYWKDVYHQVKSITTYDTLGRIKITIKWSITVSLGQLYTKCLFVVIVTWFVMHLYVHIKIVWVLLHVHYIIHSRQSICY